MSKKDKPVLGNFDEDSLNDIFKDLDEADLDGINLEDDFLGNDFLDEDFLKEFDLDNDQKQEEAGDEDILSLFGDADSIFSGVKEQMDSADTKNSNDAALEAFFGASETEEKVKEEPLSMGEFSIESLFAEGSDGGHDESPQEDEDVLKILEGLKGIDLELEEESVSAEKSEDMNNAALEDFMGQGAAPAEERHEKKEKKTKKEKKKSGDKKSFLNKLSVILFGEDEDEEEETGKKTIIDFGDSTDIETIDISGENAENLMLFGESSSEGAKKEETDKKGKKKKEKKEKKKKEKKEKPKKEKKPRPKKEKKPKPPKEPDNSPPLPKKPVILMFLMTASLVALILMGSNLLGYSNQMNNAKNLYAKQNYSEAFAEISGIEVKEEDLEIYEKYHIMAMVSTELEAYESLMNAGYYDMAIDCLIRTIGRAEKYRVDAGIYGCVQEMDSLAQEAEAVLGQMFGVSREKALELYASKTKEDYSYAIKRIIKELGLEKVSE